MFNYHRHMDQFHSHLNVGKDDKDEIQLMAKHLAEGQTISPRQRVSRTTDRMDLAAKRTIPSKTMTMTTTSDAD